MAVFSAHHPCLHTRTTAIADEVTNGLLDNDISGILGLGFGSIASSRTTPFVQTLSQQGALQQPLFSFFLTR